MKPALALFALLALAAGCDNDCEKFDRMDGTYAVWQTVTNSEASGAESTLTASENYPTTELFVNGWTRWKISYQASTKGLGIVMSDVLEATDLPGEERHYETVPLTGTLTQDESNCNSLDISIDDVYPATQTDTEGASLTTTTHTFKYTAHLIFYGDHLAGTYTYSDTYEGTDRSGAALSGQIDGVTGTFSGTLKPDDAFDTGF